jgi:hypothetical protein
MEPVQIDARTMAQDGGVILTPSMLRKARRALNWRVQDLAFVSGVPAVTIYAHEARRSCGRMHRRNNMALFEALSAAGVVFRREQSGRSTVISETVQPNRV